MENLIEQFKCSWAGVVKQMFKKDERVELKGRLNELLSMGIMI